MGANLCRDSQGYHSKIEWCSQHVHRVSAVLWMWLSLSRSDYTARCGDEEAAVGLRVPSASATQLCNWCVDRLHWCVVVGSGRQLRERLYVTRARGSWYSQNDDRLLSFHENMFEIYHGLSCFKSHNLLNGCDESIKSRRLLHNMRAQYFCYELVLGPHASTKYNKEHSRWVIHQNNTRLWPSSRVQPMSSELLYF